MSTIVTRSGKGVPLTATDHDNNVNNLNTDKVETLADLSITSTATEINLLDGVTATTAELNYVDGVTSNIQTQLGTKLPLAGGTMTGTIAGFTSTGIDDNATSTAITIDSAEKVTIGTATAATNVELSLNGVTGKAQRIEFAESGVDKWLIGQGAASETDAFEIYNTNGQMSLSIAKATSDATIVGNLVIGTSGKGIDFSATSDGSGTMTSEVLDDYEEGTWTPALRGSVTAGNTTYNTQYGFYEKIGRTVHFRGSIHVNAQGTLDGIVYVTGLPFTSNSTTQRSTVHFGYVDSLSITASESLTGTVDGGDTEFLIRIWNSSLGTSNFDDSELTDGAQFYFSGTYYV